LEALLNEKPSQTQVELAEQFGVDQATISRRLHEKGKILKLGKWVPHETSQNSIIRWLSTRISLLSRQRIKDFL
jgi:DeoR/GlpR family transcriptional regulator of sugar metabolism